MHVNNTVMFSKLHMSVQEYGYNIVQKQSFLIHYYQYATTTCKTRDVNRITSIQKYFHLKYLLVPLKLLAHERKYIFK